MQRTDGFQGVKPRQERLRTVLPARMRNGGGWSDACILNISSSGLLVYAKFAAEPGSQVELKRGAQLLIAKVVWRNNNRIGLCSHDPLRVEDIVSSETAAAAVPAITGAVEFQRDRQARNPDRSRESSRAIEFVSLVLVGTALAVAAAVFAYQTLARSLETVTRVLGAS